MAGIVLALAGLTAGDGGPGTGAARAPVAASFGGWWEGSFHTADWCNIPTRFEGRVWVSAEGKCTLSRCEIEVNPGGAFTARMMFRPRPCLCRFRGAGITLCFDERPGRLPGAFRAGPHTILLTLSPAAPRNP